MSVLCIIQYLYPIKNPFGHPFSIVGTWLGMPGMQLRSRALFQLTIVTNLLCVRTYVHDG